MSRSTPAHRAIGDEHSARSADLAPVRSVPPGDRAGARGSTQSVRVDRTADGSDLVPSDIATSTRPPRRVLSVETVAAGVLLTVIAVFWSVPKTLYCWEGAYNVARGESPDWPLAGGLVVLGLVPWGIAVAYFVTMRRRHSPAGAFVFAGGVLALVTLPVLFLRVALAAPFF